MTDLELQLIAKKAERYAGAAGAVHPEQAHVHRFNGYFQGYVEARGEMMTEEQGAKFLSLDPASMPAIPGLTPGIHKMDPIKVPELPPGVPAIGLGSFL